MKNGVTLLVLAGVGVVAALALNDALRSGTHSSGPQPAAPTRTNAPTVELVSSLATMPTVPRSSCGAIRIAPSRDYPLLVVEVVDGDVACREARDVMKVHYVGLESESWDCHGPESRTACEKPSGEAITAHFADPSASPEAQIEKTANRWAQVFAAHRRSCAHMTQPGCEWVACERVGGFTIPDCTPVTIAYRQSFGRARVEEIAIKGNRFAARFSNGELVELVGVLGGSWMVHRVGGNASTEVFER